MVQVLGERGYGGPLGSNRFGSFRPAFRRDDVDYGDQRFVGGRQGGVGAGAGVASFVGWALGVWFNIGPANFLWLVASGVMCLWLAWLGASLARQAAGR